MTSLGDLVCGLLGYPLPMLLRSTDSDAFHIVSPCFVHRLMTGEAILGPLPSPWSMIFTYPHRRKWCNSITEEFSDEDPRLPPLTGEWEQMTVDNSASNPCEWRKKGEFPNNQTREILRSDLRLMPQSLGTRVHTL